MVATINRSYYKKWLQKTCEELMETMLITEISGSQGREYEDGCLLGCCIV
jgi:hypothetical protein